MRHSPFSQTMSALNNEEHIPVEIIPIARTIFDFSSPASLKAGWIFCRARKNSAPAAAGRFPSRAVTNHAFILSRDQTSRSFRSLPQPVKACILSDPVSGHSITLYTDAPALVVYSGGFSMIPSDSGRHALRPSCAIALEAQDVPDSHMFCRNIFPSQRRNIRLRRTIRIQIR